ncbi:MAG: hypothetical protein ACLFVJ_07300 [Persicimonas sp.]
MKKLRSTYLAIRIALANLWANLTAWFEPPEKRRARLITRMQGQAPYNIDALLAEYGIAPLDEPPAKEIKPVTGALVRENAEPGADLVFELGEQSEIGKPGTYFVGGLPDVETTAKYRAYNVRGFASRPGDFEDYYRQEPIIRHSVDSVTEVQVSARRDVQMPETLPYDEATVERLRKWCEWADGRLRNLAQGFQHYVTHATSSTATFGFAIFEVVWAWDDAYDPITGEGRAWPIKLGYREPSTVDDWIMNDRQDELVAVRFRMGGEASGSYVLPAGGEDMRDQRVLLCRVAGRGNNWEGISPIRPAMHWIRFKQLLGQIAAATAQKYGVPTTFIKRDPDSDYGTDDNGADDTQAVLAAKQAVEAAVVLLPDGITAELESPQGTMPSFQELITYCDDQIARGFSNEGSLLGHNQVGSYALAEVQDNAFMRSAPHWSRIIMEPINELLRTMCKHEFGELPAYPTMGFRLDAMHDTGAQVADMVQLHGGQPVSQWTEDARHWAAEKMNLDPDTFSVVEADDDSDTQGALAGDRQFNGAQIQSMAQVVQQVALDELPLEGAVEILKLGFNISETRARAFFRDSDVKRPVEGEPATEDDDESEPVQLSEAEASRIRECADHFAGHAEDVQKFMDDVEAKLGKSFGRVAEEQRRWFRDRTQDLVDDDRLPPEAFADRLESIKEEARRRFEEDYREEATAAAMLLLINGATRVAEEMGVSVTGKLDAPTLPDEIEAQLQATINKVADEASSRNTAHMRDQRVQQKAGNRSRSVQRLKTTSLIGVAKKVGGRAFNAGRDAVVQTAKKVVEKTQGTINTDAGPVDVGKIGEVPRITCVRSSMLDKDVCKECLKRDFERGGPEYILGSGSYYSDMPPEPCLGGENCRCVYIYDAPPAMVEAVKQLVGANFAIGDIVNRAV